MSNQTIVERFEGVFGDLPEYLVRAPGRVNLIGEHTDYNDGFVFPAAIDREVLIAARRSHRSKSRIISENFDEPLEVAMRGIPVASVQGWGAYPAGVAWTLQEMGFEDLNEIDAYVTSNLPMGSGVSSSAALEVGFTVLWNNLGNYLLNRTEMAKVAQRCETRFVGVSCGIMDMTASLFGKAQHAMEIDTRSMEIRHAPLPGELSIVLCDTQTPRTLAGSAYNQRRAECEAVCKILEVGSLRDASLDQLTLLENEPTLLKRARHVITENSRCLMFFEALRTSDMGQIRELLLASHASLRDDYEVSSPALDAMVESCQDATGCIGVRLTGAGFGGACIAIVEHSKANNFESEAYIRYVEAGFDPPQFMALKCSEGASALAF